MKMITIVGNEEMIMEFAKMLKNINDTPVYLAIEKNHAHIFVENMSKVKIENCESDEKAMRFIKKEPNMRFFEL